MASTLTRATMAGLIVAGGLAAAELVAMVILKIREPAFFDFFRGFGAITYASFFSLVAAGNPLPGALIGAVAGRATRSPGMAAAAGALAGAIGYVGMVLVSYLGWSLFFGSGDVWKSYPDTFWNLPIAAVAACLAAVGMAYARREHAPAAAPQPPRRVKCPRCPNILTVAPGQRPVCDKCGFGRSGSQPL